MSSPIRLLERSRCHIELAEPSPDAEFWSQQPQQPAPLWPPYKYGAFPATEVRAVASDDALCVRFDCFLTQPSRLVPPTHVAPLDQSEHVSVTINPANDTVREAVFRADFRGIRDAVWRRNMPGEVNLEAVPDVWQDSAPFTAPWHRYHGVATDRWWCEFVIPWRSLGLEHRPVTVGFAYSRVHRTGQWPELHGQRWPEPATNATVAATLAAGEALIGEAAAPTAMLLEPPVFGENRGWLDLPEASRMAVDSMEVAVISPDGTAKSTRRYALDVANDCVFGYRLELAQCSHVDVFRPFFLQLTLRQGERARYQACLPMDRHLGLCVDLSREASLETATHRERTIARMRSLLPRFERSNTRQGAPSDFCLVDGEAGLTIDLMDNDAWLRLAEVIEARCESTEERLLGALALVADKAVTNLIACPMFFRADGRHQYHSAMHELMGPLSILRYGGGTAVARAAVLARLLQHVRTPDGKRFSTRVLSLGMAGGPVQCDGNYPGLASRAPFVQEPQRIGAVAVDHNGSQTLLDPTGLCFFVRDDGTLATVEEVAEPELAAAGAGRLAAAYQNIDVEELRRHPTNRLLSRGVFPELCEDEDGSAGDLDIGYCQRPPVLIANDASSALSLKAPPWAPDAQRSGSVVATFDGRWLHVQTRVTGIDPTVWQARDRRAERVHLGLDLAHEHLEFCHFSSNLTGDARAAREQSSGIQTLFKHLATENHRHLADIEADIFKVDIVENREGYELHFSVDLEPLSKRGPVVGVNVWVDGRYPEYEQVFAAFPAARLPASPFAFADLYLEPPAVTADVIDFGMLCWGENHIRMTIQNRGAVGAELLIQATTRSAMNRREQATAPVTLLVPPLSSVDVELPYVIDGRDKMGTGGCQWLDVKAVANDATVFAASWPLSYCGTPSVYQRYRWGDDVDCSNPMPGDADFLARKIRFICSRLPDIKRRTTRDGAPSDFCLYAEDETLLFDLMADHVLDVMAREIEARYDNDMDRVLGMLYLAQHPEVIRHLSGGHRFINLCGPLSILRANHAGGGGNCGYHSRAFAGMAARLRIAGEPLVAHTVGVYGHCIAAVAWRGSKVLLDADVGHFMLLPDGSDFATIEEFRADPSGILTTAGPGELGRYFCAQLDYVLSAMSIVDSDYPGVFPPGAPRGCV